LDATTTFDLDADPLETGCDDVDNPDLIYNPTVDHVFDISPQANSALTHAVYADDMAAPFCYMHYYMATDFYTLSYVDVIELFWTENLAGVPAPALWEISDDILNLEIVTNSWDDVSNKLAFVTEGDYYETGVNGGAEPVITFIGTDELADVSGNVPDYTSSTLDDKALPYIYAWWYDDADVNGTVETVNVVWSEHVNFTFDLADWDLVNNDDLNLIVIGATHTDAHTQLEVDADALETGCDENGNPEISYINNSNNVFDISPEANNAEGSYYHEIYDNADPFCYEYYYLYDSWSITNYVSEFRLIWTENLIGDLTNLGVWSMTDVTLNLAISSISWDDPTNTIRFVTTADLDETGCNGGAEPVVNFLGTDELMDIAGNIPAYAGSTLNDLAIPQQHSWIYLDADIDGQVETVQVEYTEFISFTWHADDWALGNNLDLNLGFSSVVVTNAMVAFTVTSDPNETGCDNNGNPTITYTNNNNRVSDISAQANVAPTTGPVEVADLAAPFCIMNTGTYTDVDASGSVDRADLYFTEDLVGFAYTPVDWPIEGGDLGLVINTAMAPTNNAILFSVNGNPCMTGVENEFGVEPNFIYTPNAPEHIQDSSGNITGGFNRILIDDANPILNSCVTPVAYSDDTFNGVVDHIYLRFTEQVNCNTAGAVWDIGLPLINFYPNPTAIEGSGTSELGLTGFSVPAYMTFLENATVALTSGSVAYDNDGNYLDAFGDLLMADEALPVAYIVTADKDPVFLGERQHLDVVFSELVVQDGSLDPDVVYNTTGDVQREVTCTTNPEWIAYFYPQFPEIVQSRYIVDADDVILFGETGDALVGIAGAVDINGNIMAVCPPHPHEYTFAIDARAAILVSSNSTGTLEAGVPFVVHVEAMDAGGIILDEYYGEFVEFSTNLDDDQIIMPSGAIPLANGVGDFTITVMEVVDDFCLYVREEGGRIDNVGYGDGPYTVIAPVIDAPDASWAEDSPQDQGNFIDLYCDFSDNDPASPVYDEDEVGYNFITEYRWYKNTGNY
ncbi:hypothetical protein K8R42_03760, partial [bacterium]|nr:hypothetical protein [bacterium]